MASQLGPLEVICDAPPYPIVRACNAIGVESPEDVRWINAAHHIDGDGHPLNVCACELEKPKPKPKAGFSYLLCGYGAKPVPMPPLAKYRFTYSSGDEVTYSVGQCPKCRTVFWMDGIAPLS